MVLTQLVRLPNIVPNHHISHLTMLMITNVIYLLLFKVLSDAFYSSGIYSGTSATTIDTASVLGEWIQIDTPTLKTVTCISIQGMTDS